VIESEILQTISSSSEEVSSITAAEEAEDGGDSNSKESEDSADGLLTDIGRRFRQTDKQKVNGRRETK